MQEARTERVLEALRDLTSRRALVIRAGERLRMVVRDDLIVLAEGDRVPAAQEPAFLAAPPLAGIAVLLVLEALKPIWRSAVRQGTRP